MRQIERRAQELKAAHEAAMQPLEGVHYEQRMRDNRTYIEEFIQSMKERGISPLKLLPKGEGWIISRPNTASLFAEFRFIQDDVPGSIVTTGGELVDFSGYTLREYYPGLGDDFAIDTGFSRSLALCQSSVLRDALAYALVLHENGGFAHCGQYPYPSV